MDGLKKDDESQDRGRDENRSRESGTRGKEAIRGGGTVNKVEDIFKSRSGTDFGQVGT
jgi:hypothetical protein